MKIILTPFMYLAGLGLVLNLILHASSLLGWIPPAYNSQLPQAARYLNQAMFVIIAVSILASNSICKDFKPTDFWIVAIRGCPRWLKYLPVSLFTYSLLFFIINYILGINASSASFDEVQASSVVGMTTYALCLAILYSALHVQEVDETRKCPNGHQLSPAAKFCEKCGAQVLEYSDRSNQKGRTSI